jgi:transposase
LKIKICPTVHQRKILDEWINTSNYVYNKTIEEINKGHVINFKTLRDKIVTKNTKKKNTQYQELTNQIKQLQQQKQTLQTLQSDNKDLIQQINNTLVVNKHELLALPSTTNTDINIWEYDTPKEVRAGAVNDVCKAYKTGFTNLKIGNINHFRLGYRKNSNAIKTALIPKNFIKVNKGVISIAPQFFTKEKCLFNMGKKTFKKHKSLQINHDSRIQKYKDQYWLVIPIDVEINKKSKPVNYCGIDPGVRTFMTSFGNHGCYEYTHNQNLLTTLNKKLQILKSLRIRPRERHERNRYRKHSMNKIEKRKKSIIDEAHWKTIVHLLHENDYIFYGDIKSHDIVKEGVNTTLNRNINDLKFYQFKQRLLYKASILNKCVFEINEAYTTQTCSFCGTMYKPGCSKVYNCLNCKISVDRDINASKNILMKGIMTCLY